MTDLDQLERERKDHEIVTDNLKTALEYEQNLNHQLMGKLDVCQNTMVMIMKLLIDKATERR